MGIKIVKSSDIVKANNIVTTIFGLPGVGKTTLAATAKNVLMIDADGGLLRAGKKTDSISVNKWGDIESICREDVIGYDTLVVDTTGRLCEILSEDIISKNPRMGNGYSLSLKGFGELSAIFKKFISKIKGFGIDIILISHAVEKEDNDIVKLRIDTPGSSKMEIYKCSDLIGHIYIANNKRMLNFSHTDKAIGKNCANLAIMEIPHIKDNINFMADIIQKAKDNLNSLTDDQIAMQIKYDSAITDINNATDSKDINLFNDFLLDDYKRTNHALKTLFHNRALELGYLYVASDKKYIDPNDPTILSQNEIKAKKNAEKLLIESESVVA